MKATHTKGEWKIEGQLDTTTIMSGETHIALVMACDFKDREEQNANARLIASAPTMLQTLQECLDVYENKEQNGGGLAMYETCLKLTIVKAIEKATNP